MKEMIVDDILCSSERVLHSLIVEGKKKEKYWAALA